MAKIPVSRREFEKGWLRARSTYSSAAEPRNNAHRLLLFYAVENGLKALIMRLEMIRDGAEGFDEVHDLNKLLVRAKGTSRLLLSQNVIIRDQVGPLPRNCAVGQINQMWRYGCTAQTPTDEILEGQLNSVATWLEENL